MYISKTLFIIWVDSIGPHSDVSTPLATPDTLSVQQRPTTVLLQPIINYSD